MSDGIAIIRALGALLTVLGILGGALWAVRRYNIVLPGSGAARTGRRLAVVERLSLDPRRSLALVRRDGIEHLILIAPEGHLVVETRITPQVSCEAVAAPMAASMPARDARALFSAMVERARRPAADAPDADASKVATTPGRYA